MRLSYFMNLAVVRYLASLASHLPTGRQALRLHNLTVHFDIIVIICFI
jgi:hypothetical protein